MKRNMFRYIFDESDLLLSNLGHKPSPDEHLKIHYCFRANCNNLCHYIDINILFIINFVMILYRIVPVLLIIQMIKSGCVFIFSFFFFVFFFVTELCHYYFIIMVLLLWLGFIINDVVIVAVVIAVWFGYYCCCYCDLLWFGLVIVAVVVFLLLLLL
ncbi:hypothetical protein RFI_10851 [Reticulomyxa filosa]|uniref:Uncharacterized protein n=1 Tax=Reticulomyxa filosa TaxID=46433 RepID=X6NKM1_RETFI|nr:hypothetical protein RFI_10851 [Reticulomyxa filosa]|eukprot:ETO26284.1 hypothetical protein RFI_10851 [Reticulomyxa filosa]